jgi:hypothetical protein
MASVTERPFELLRLIRDGAVSHVSDLRRVDARSYHLIDAELEKLVRAGLITRSADGDLAPTPRLRRIFGALGVSLTQLSPFMPGSVISSPVFGPPVAPIVKADVLSVMPFSEALLSVYKEHVRPVVRGLGLTVARSDDFFAASAVISDVWNAIFASRVIVADCTGRNANVFYEIGIAHTLGRPVVLIAQDTRDIPFDLRHLRVLIYDNTPPGMREFDVQLEATIRYEMSRPRSLSDLLGPRNSSIV